MATNIRDPRSIITPDAFGIDPALLGTPLAKPWKRLWALLIDLLVIGVLTAATSSISLILWGAVAAFFIMMAFRRPGRGFGQVSSVLFRSATGCLGVLILLGVLIGYIVLRSGEDIAEGAARAAASALGDADLAEGPNGIRLSDLVGGIADVTALDDIEDPEEAAEVLARLLRSADRAGLSPNEARAFLDGVAPADPPWSSARDSVYAMAFRRAGLGIPSVPTEADTPTPDVDALSDAEALARFAELDPGASAGTLEASEGAEYDALRRRVAARVARDTLAALAERIDDVEDDLERSETRLDETQRALDEEKRGFFALLRDIWDQAGSAIGLWSLYFTTALTLTGGRTVGKKILGIRVLRLDGEPLNWWASFERAGGYVAGIATGTLGFVQVFWDPNRQCVHDKIGGTVVVVDGAVAVPGAVDEAWSPAGHEEG